MGTARAQLGHTLALAKSVGLGSALNLVARRAFGRSAPVTVSCGPHRLSVRPGDSDPYVLAQIFTGGEYAAHPFWMERLKAAAAQLRAAGRTPVIVDAGANVGYSAVYLAAHFPDAVVLAVEPDPACVTAIERNRGDDARITVVHAALWSHEDGVRLETGEDKGSWANRVGSSPAGSAAVTPSVTLETLLASVPDAAPFLLKLDIEGAETEVCRASAAAVASFACIMVEPHDWMLPGAGGLSPLYQAVAGKTMDTLVRGETLMLFDCAVLDELAASPVS